MNIEELDFDLPSEAIAQSPADPRDSCRLMHLTAVGGTEHLVFSDLPHLLRRGDTVVLNDSKVLPARVLARKPSGGELELLFLHSVSVPGDADGDCWEALVRPSRRLRVGSEMIVGEREHLEVVQERGEGRWVVRATEGQSLVSLMEAHGRLPLPPYIEVYPEEPSVYQTVYASALGSAAAPTAGLHFTTKLLERLSASGIDSARVTLHVGLDTFLPIRESVVEAHRIHTESYDVTPQALKKIRATRSRGGRVVAVGTTVTRVLETLAEKGAFSCEEPCGPFTGSTAIYITPGYEFSAVDALLTNFHLPRSTVLTLTMAFAGVERLKTAYAEALDAGYRFFSFGDAMLIDKMTPQSPTRDLRDV
jgi:S-adenosylmethionine:tRNA ribosyltransferase-isomerase